VDRLVPLTGPDRVLVVTGARHAAAVGAQLPEVAGGDGPERVLAEPSPRDSMAAIGLAAAVLLERHGEDVVLGSFAADHVIDGAEEFARTVREGVAAARAGYVVTIGIAATGPSTAFGYVRAGDPLGLDGAPSVRAVSGFTEKPDEETAAAYLATGEYRWNAGMFIVRARVLLDHLAAQLPALHDGLRTIAAAWDGPERDATLAALWPGLTKIAIDHAIAEPVAAAGGVAVVPGDFTWDDVGDFASLGTLLGDGATLGDDAAVLRVGAADALVVPAGRRTVTVVGLPGAVVVDTPDAVLVTTREHAQQVKAAVDGWRAHGRDDLL
jgi:mannose-1-phosphate guanylyltransferase